ncbi:hypothetical protein AA313_de0203893 [Arthrobotrys entomopaga]|nr:hypothetical protein AA313_de0203893 [Arthrobotrys entomopaga]
MGVSPISSLFKYHWVKAFLGIALRHKNVPIIKEIKRAGFISPWDDFGLDLSTSGRNAQAGRSGEASYENFGKLVAEAWSALEDAVDFDPRDFSPEKKKRCEELGKKLDKKSKILRQDLEKVSAQCQTQWQNGKNDPATDPEINLFNGLLEVLEIAFDLLTSNKELYDEWEKEAERQRVEMITAGSAAFTAFTAVALHVSLGAAVTSTAALCPFTLLCITGAGFFIRENAYSEAADERENARKVDGQVRSIHETLSAFTNFLLYSSSRIGSEDIPNLTPEESIMLREIRTLPSLAPRSPVRNTSFRTDFKRILDFVRKTLAARKSQN